MKVGQAIRANHGVKGAQGMAGNQSAAIRHSAALRHGQPCQSGHGVRMAGTQTQTEGFVVKNKFRLTEEMRHLKQGITNQ